MKKRVPRNTAKILTEILAEILAPSHACFRACFRARSRACFLACSRACFLACFRARSLVCPPVRLLTEGRSSTSTSEAAIGQHALHAQPVRQHARPRGGRMGSRPQCVHIRVCLHRILTYKNPVIVVQYLLREFRSCVKRRATSTKTSHKNKQRTKKKRRKILAKLLQRMLSDIYARQGKVTRLEEVD